MHPKSEKTLILIKPDGVQRGLIGEVMKRFERAGLKLVGIKMHLPTEDMIEKHYEGKTGDLLTNLKKFMVSGPSVAMVWEGIQSVAVVRKLVGSTEPHSSDVGTIRGDYTIDSYKLADTDGRAVRNIIHASGTPEEAETEIALWFKQEELMNYKLVQEKILYDVNLDGILE